MEGNRVSSSPLAACGAILVGLAVVGLARGYERSRPASAPALNAPTLADAGLPDASTSQVDRLLADRPLDVNAATAEELQLLPRIGPTLASRIVAERERGGRFRSLEDLTRVRGIGPRTVERLAPLATAGPAPARDTEP